MKINRSKGVSVTVFNSNNRLERKLRLASNGLEVSLYSLTRSDPDLLVRQYISGLDKILAKPRNPDDMHLTWCEHRTKLGAAVWDRLVTRLPNSIQDDRLAFGRIKRNWEWKLHPYATGSSMDDYRKYLANKKPRKGSDGRPLPPAKFEGSRFSVVAQDGVLDFEIAAEYIDKHLFNQEKRIDGSVRTGRGKEPSNIGLIEARAKSIRESVYLKNDKPQEIAADPIWKTPDLEVYGRPDLANKIYNLATTKENKKDKVGRPAPQRLSAKDVGGLMFQHYKDIGLCDQSMDAEKKKRLQDLHNAVRDFYKRIVKGSKRGTDDHKFHYLSERLPRNHAALVDLLAKVEGNSAMGDFIRHGRNAYYARLNFEDTKRFATQDEASRYFWTSEGQAEIKRAEAFTRMWRTVKDQAARTAKSWADKSGEFSEGIGDLVSDDVLLESAIAKITGDGFDPAWFSQKAELLLGAASRPFMEASLETQRQLMLTALKVTSRIRTDVVHFTSRQRFANRLRNSIKDLIDQNQIGAEAQAIIGKLYVEDESELDARIERDLTGAMVHEFIPGDLYQKLVNELRVSEATDIPLPRYNRIVDRLEGTIEHVDRNKAGLRISIAMKVNRLELEEPHARAKYVALKALYEKRFATWLGKLPTEKLQIYLDQALAESAVLAKAPNRGSPFQALIQPKIDRVRMRAEKGLLEIFDELAGIVATEMRDQNAYQPNPAKAREKSAWVEYFKCDLLAIAFAAYLHEAGFSRIATIENKNHVPCPAPKIAPQSRQGLKDEAWKANLYFFLHLVPVEDASGLYHQFRKMAVLEAKGRAGDSEAAIMQDVKDVVALYLAMNADKFEGTVTNTDISGFGKFFEKREDFERMYAGENSLDAPVVSMKRGLRQIMRFGHLARLEKIFANNKIKSETVSQVLAAERKQAGQLSQIAQDQRQREKEHAAFNKITRVDNETTLNRIRNYAALTKRISQHRHNAANVRLTTHLSLHHLMMRVLSRLIDYAGTWERDRMFVFLGMIAQQNGAEGLKGVKLKEMTGGRLWYSDRDNKGKGLLTDLLNESNRALFDTHFGQAQAQVRNYFAHYNNLALARDDIDLTAEINKVRGLVAYDRKLKNAVSKSIKDLLSREGLEISWVSEDHQLKLEGQVKSVSAAHLSKLKYDREMDGQLVSVIKNGLKEPLHSKLMEGLVTELFRESPSEKR